MNSKAKYIVLLVSSVVVLYAIIGGMMGRANPQAGSYQQLATFMEVVQRVQSDYVDDPIFAAAFAGAIRGMVERVDPYGGYLSPESVNFYENFDAQTTGSIGVILAKKFDYPMIVSAVSGGPAARAGFGTGDTIEAISGESLRELNLIEVNQLLAGKPGSEVELTVIRRRRPEPETVTLMREVVRPPAIESRIVQEKIGYLKPHSLVPGKASEVERHLELLGDQGAAGIVLDLRNMAEGDAREAYKLANLFIESGNLGYLEGQTVERENYVANSADVVSLLPLVVLINEGTGAAAEIAAAAISENSRAELVGLKTFGLGSIQRLIKLEDGWALLLSVANYYSPNGRELQKEGVEPTVEVSETATIDPLASPKETAIETDRQLNRAIEILTESSRGKGKAA